MLSECTADEDEPIPRTPSSQLCLETLILSVYYNPYVYRWAMRWVTRLTSLEMPDMSLDLDWTPFPELLVACSNTLTSLHLGMRNNCMCYLSMVSLKFTCLIGYEGELPFTLSALKRLKRLSISAVITKNQWALPEIMRVMKTVPTIPDVVLRFHCCALGFSSLAQLNWSLLDHPQFNLTGKRPRIDLCVTGDGITLERIIGALAANEALTDLVKRDFVILRSEHI